MEQSRNKRVGIATWERALNSSVKGKEMRLAQDPDHKRRIWVIALKTGD